MGEASAMGKGEWVRRRPEACSGESVRRRARTASGDTARQVRPLSAVPAPWHSGEAATSRQDEAPPLPPRSGDEAAIASAVALVAVASTMVAVATELAACCASAVSLSLHCGSPSLLKWQTSVPSSCCAGFMPRRRRSRAFSLLNRRSSESRSRTSSLSRRSRSFSPLNRRSSASRPRSSAFSLLKRRSSKSSSSIWVACCRRKMSMSLVIFRMRASHILPSSANTATIFSKRT
mmetsp:Transcript_21725/g.60270  ORF Transcript_21725/g.60270 Transcript_21725/m.60270 type:complete len:234 (+) Transcript_21725:262-963(+)